LTLIKWQAQPIWQYLGKAAKMGATISDIENILFERTNLCKYYAWAAAYIKNVNGTISKIIKEFWLNKKEPGIE
jgi:hypothetical protein